MGNADSPILFFSVIFCLVLGAKSAQSAALKNTDEVCILGEECVLKCNSESQIVKVLWHYEKDPVPIVYYPEDLNYSRHIKLRNRTSLSEEKIFKGDASLLLRPVQIQDEGTYRCDLSSVDTLVNIQVSAPVVEVLLQQEGDELKCRSEGIYPQPDVTWTPSTQHDTDFYPTESGLYDISSSVRLSDPTADEYTCNVSTPFSWKITTFKPLTVTSAPHPADLCYLSFLLMLVPLGGLILLVWHCCRKKNAQKKKADSPRVRKTSDEKPEELELTPRTNGHTPREINGYQKIADQGREMEIEKNQNGACHHSDSSQL